MKSSITLKQLKVIADSHDVDLSERTLANILEQSNEQADVVYYHHTTGAPLPTRSAREWADYFVSGEADQQRCDGLSAEQFQRDVYGND